MSTIRVGATKKYVKNWGLAFGAKPAANSSETAKKASKKATSGTKATGGKK